MNKKLPQAMIVGKDIRCPVCGRKWGEIHGADEIIKNYEVRCPRKYHGACHSFLHNPIPAICVSDPAIASATS